MYCWCQAISAFATVRSSAAPTRCCQRFHGHALLRPVLNCRVGCSWFQARFVPCCRWFTLLLCAAADADAAAAADAFCVCAVVCCFRSWALELCMSRAHVQTDKRDFQASLNWKPPRHLNLSFQLQSLPQLKPRTQEMRSFLSAQAPRSRVGLSRPPRLAEACQELP